MEFRRKRRDAITMDITPLVDVVFLLLIFFMLSTTFIVAPGIRIDLPKATAQPVKSSTGDIRIKVDSEGSYYLADKKVEPEALEEELRLSATLNPATLVVIEADSSTQHQFVVGAMDRARTAGLNRMAIATKAKKKP